MTSMNDIFQYVIAGIIVGAALWAAVRSIVRAVTSRKTSLTACTDCKLHDICQKPEGNDGENVSAGSDCLSKNAYLCRLDNNVKIKNKTR